MAVQVIPSDVLIQGNLRASSMTIPTNAVGDSQADSGNPIGATKLQHQHAQRFEQPHGTAATSERRVVHVARGAGTLTEVRAGLVVACLGAATIVVEVLKNGVNVLTSTLTIDNSIAAFGSVLGVFGTVTYAAGDVFEVKTTATAGGGTLGQGVFAGLALREAAD